MLRMRIEEDSADPNWTSALVCVRACAVSAPAPSPSRLLCWRALHTHPGCLMLAIDLHGVRVLLCVRARARATAHPWSKHYAGGMDHFGAADAHLRPQTRQKRPRRTLRTRRCRCASLSMRKTLNDHGGGGACGPRACWCPRLHA